MDIGCDVTTTARVRRPQNKKEESQPKAGWPHSREGSSPKAWSGLAGRAHQPCFVAQEGLRRSLHDKTPAVGPLAFCNQAFALERNEKRFGFGIGGL